MFGFRLLPCGDRAGGGEALRPALSPTVHAGRVGEVALPSQRPGPRWPQAAVWFCLSPGPQVSPAGPIPASLSSGESV